MWLGELGHASRMFCTVILDVCLRVIILYLMVILAGFGCESGADGPI